MRAGVPLLAALLLMVASSLLAGALGLQTTQSCDANATNVGQKMDCYQVAAVTMAYAGNPSQARSICASIWDNWGGSNNDTAKKAEVVSNNCYFDVARITKDPTACGYITEHNSINSNLFGSLVTSDMCYDEVNRLMNITPENYYTSGRTSLCSIVFILPLLAVGALRFARN